MRSIVTVLLFLLLAMPAFAATTSSREQAAPATGGFQGPSGHPAPVTTVAQALQARDDTRCVLEGTIISSGPKHEQYLFQDATGKIIVEIDDKLFAGRTVTPQNTVRLYGEVDTELFRNAEVDVEAFEILH